MIVIESSALLTIASTVAGMIVSIGATWYFAKRHYSKNGEPASPQQIELEIVKNRFRFLATIVIVSSAFFLLLFGIYGLIVIGLNQSG